VSNAVTALFSVAAFVFFALIVREFGVPHRAQVLPTAN
jgi:hypothetical protein